MKNLEVKNISYSGKCTYEVRDGLKGLSAPEYLYHFSYKFNFGKCYILKSEICFGAWAASYVISGKIPQNEGTISIDGAIINQKNDKLYQ
jgi:hypothetical protein